MLSQQIAQPSSHRIWHKQTAIFLFIYIAARVLSFFTHQNATMQSLVAGAIIATFVTLYFKKQAWAHALILLEIILGGAGHFFELFGLSIRTWLILVIFSALLIDLGQGKS